MFPIEKVNCTIMPPSSSTECHLTARITYDLWINVRDSNALIPSRFSIFLRPERKSLQNEFRSTTDVRSCKMCRCHRKKKLFHYLYFSLLLSRSSRSLSGYQHHWNLCFFRSCSVETFKKVAYWITSDVIRAKQEIKDTQTPHCCWCSVSLPDIARDLYRLKKSDSGMDWLWN